MPPRIPRSRTWLLTYAACLLCVLSFIAFDVLDLDGSDFELLKRVQPIEPNAPPHGVRRIAMLPEVPDALIDPRVLPETIFRAEAAVEAHPVVRALVDAQRFPPALPRASLDVLLV